MRGPTVYLAPGATFGSTGPTAKSHRRAVTVYQCPSCDTRTLGQQRCDDCNTFMRAIGIGGPCPECAAPIAVSELIAQEVIATD